MKLTITAENEEDRKKISGEVVEYRDVHTCGLALVVKAAGVIPEEHTRTFGDGHWLIGKLYYLLKLVERTLDADTSRI